MKRTKGAKPKPKLGFFRLNKALLQVYDPATAVFLVNLIEKYAMFLKRGKLLDGEWFYQTHKQMTDETGMKVDKLRSCKNTLVKDGVIDTKIMWCPPKEFYRINKETLIERTLVGNDNEWETLIKRTLVGIDNDRETQRIKKEIIKKEKNTMYGVGDFSSKDFNGDERITPSMFLSFWRLYPNKVHKGAAEIEWNKLCSSPDAPETRFMFQRLRGWIQAETWVHNPKWIPMPKNYLIKKYWEDDPKKAKVHHTDNKPEKLDAEGRRWTLGPDGHYWNSDGELLRDEDYYLKRR